MLIGGTRRQVRPDTALYSGGSRRPDHGTGLGVTAPGRCSPRSPRGQFDSLSALWRVTLAAAVGLFVLAVAAAIPAPASLDRAIHRVPLNLLDVTESPVVVLVALAVLTVVLAAVLVVLLMALSLLVVLTVPILGVVIGLLFLAVIRRTGAFETG